MYLIILILLMCLLICRAGFAAGLYELDSSTSFAVSPENLTGAGGGGALPELMGGQKPSPCIHINPGETAVLADYKGEGTIDSIWIGGHVLPELILRIYWDGAAVPAVECPLPAFFAHAVRTDINHAENRFPILNSSQVFISPNHGMNCYWKMPFRRSFRITLENTAGFPVDSFYIFNGTLKKLPDNIGWFHTQYRENLPVTPGQSITVLDGIRGRGAYLGTAICLRTNYDSTCWCEGEVRFYLDGDTERPSINFTGLEDYLCGSFAWNVNGTYQTVSGLYAGLYCINHTNATMGRTADTYMGYRWHITDAISFGSDIRVTMFDLGWNRTTTGFKLREDDIITTAYYYLDTPEGQRPETVYDLNIPLSGTDNMIWNWWYYPQVISADDRLFWTFTTREGYTGIAMNSQKTGKTQKTYLKLQGHDDHNSAALYITKAGKILCAYAGGHNNENNIHIRISRKPCDITRFERDIPLPSRGGTCYSQLIYSGERLNLFYRIDNTAWAWRYSTDEGLSWSEEKVLISAPVQYYCRFTATTRDGLIRINMYSNPDQPETDIRQGFLDTRASLLLNSSLEPMGKAEETGFAAFDVLIPTEQGLTQRMLDIAITAPERPLILYTPFSMTTGEYTCKLYDKGKTTVLANGKHPIWFPKYQGGAAWLDNSLIALSVSDGKTDFVELWSYEDGKAAKLREIHSEAIGGRAIRNARPICDINGKAFLWHRGEYTENNYVDFNTEARIYRISKNEL